MSRQGGAVDRSVGSAAVLAVSCAVVCANAAAQNPFAVEVVEYAPAPGQFVNDAAFNEPMTALGPPVGGGTSAPDNSSVVTLGGFGGLIVLRFDHVVEDDPLNPFGIDAIVFGNAFWFGGDVNAHSAECATIEIALDANGNRRIDGEEGWYLIPGSHIADPVGQWQVQTWDDDPDTATPPAHLSWVPVGRSGKWVTEGHRLPELFEDLVVRNPALEPEAEAIFGYADYAPTLILGDTNGDDVADDAGLTPDRFYTVPDDPHTVGITPGSGGGDGFDVAWAVDPDTGKRADLPGFDFIRITNATNVTLGPLGEKSAEIDAVADAAPDPFGDCDEDGDIDLLDTVCVQLCFGWEVTGDALCEPLDRDGSGVVDGAEAVRAIERMTGPM